MNHKTIWILTHKKAGDRKQMEVLAQALGWPCTIKRLAFRPLNVPALAKFLLDHRESDPLEPPWPDLVFCAEARVSVIAQLLKRQSRGAIKTICIGRPAGNPDNFDLVLTTPQYRLAPASNVVELSLPLVSGEAQTADLSPDNRWLTASRPIITVLIGGTSPPEALNERVAQDLATAVSAYARKRRGTLLVTTSPRTSKAAASALLNSLTPPDKVHLWNEGKVNPYREFLVLANEIIVTSDSVSMVAEALATGKPVSVYRLPRQWPPTKRMIERAHLRLSRRGPVPFWLTPVKWMFDIGLIEARPDRELVYNKLIAENRLVWFGETVFTANPAPTDEMKLVAERINRLFWPQSQ